MLHYFRDVFKIITVSDSSTDGSPLTLESSRKCFRRVAYATNVGKGHTLRTGLAMGCGRYLGFIDADGDISPEFLASSISVMHAEEADVIIGSKRHRGLFGALDAVTSVLFVGGTGSSSTSSSDSM